MGKKYNYLIIIFLIVASFIAYGRILGNEFIDYDDYKFITENKNVQSDINAESIKWAFTASYYPDFWHPLTWLSIMLDWSLFGANASGHHLVSLLLHIASVLLLFLFLNRTTKSLWSSAFVAAFFSLHPLRVESVAWAAERKDVLSVFFGMATIYAYAYYVEKPKLSKYFLCLLLFALALMSKPMLVTLPFLMLLLDYWPLERWKQEIKPITNEAQVIPLKKKGKKQKTQSIKQNISVKAKEQPTIGQLLWEKVPFTFLSVALTIMVVWQLKDTGAFTSLQHLPLFKRVMNAIISYVSYLDKTFWPVDLAVFYPYQYSFPGWQVLGAAAILIIISIAVIYFMKKAPFLFVGWFWYLGALVPVIGLVQGGSQAMADRYTYLPSIGIGIMLAWGIPLLLKRDEIRKKILFPAGIATLAILAVLTWRQCGYWRNSIEIFNHALNVTSDNYVAHNGLGVALAEMGKYDEAILHYRQAIKINPGYYYGYYNLANTFKDEGNMEEAAKYFHETILINPNFADAHINMGLILAVNYKKYDEAIYHFRQALQIDQDNPDTHVNLAIALANKGELKEAIEHFHTAIYLKPNDEQARRALREVIELEQRHKQREIK